ncbi:peptide chain release factor N(5)-glutamine methyltransferase [Gordonia sp. ABSL11-1]|uniref:peptide chain release factor N(5)-glutamine methyltransferase n=1 Tax=Gordonia sp. ABSL11-1 TaxID=3053924 RepID=UPI00257298C7|nr:peptide chain release factor N(5)-glutamine methyltransferase [Gordonia sp. ABSL11-1]MDL9946047.1 peptide chain release factor N(5)-glutamine methyltransferase [Gordonia sp. ABSL11-1]
MTSAGQPSPIRVDDELAWARDRLHAAGIDSARSDAEWLLADVLGVERGRLVILDDLDPTARSRFRTAVDSRCARIPLQHIVGTAAFGPAELAVGPGVFTPRPETEFLAEWAADAAHGSSAPVIVDLCSGSGALAIAIASIVPGADVTAVERSPSALEWLSRNVAAAEEHGVAVTVLPADVTDAGRMADAFPGGTVDIVVANPPYVPEGADVAPEVAHDPPEAVFAGADGMSVIVPMLTVVADMLRAGGVVGIEHDESTSPAVTTALAATGHFADIRARDDLTGRPRFVTARRIG